MIANRRLNSLAKNLIISLRTITPACRYIAEIPRETSYRICNLSGYNRFSTTSSFLNKNEQYMTLVDKKQLTQDTYRFRFKFSDKTPIYLGLPPGQHLRFFAPNCQGVEPGKWNGRPDGEADMKEIVRRYTPVTPKSETRGFVDMVIKVYKPVPGVFEDGGKFSRYIDQLKIGGNVKMIGPCGLTEYFGHGQFSHKDVLGPTHKNVGLIAGGSGVTPILQVLLESFEDPSDNTSFRLLYANKTPDDIIERNLLDELEQVHPNRFSCWHVVESVQSKDEPWRYSVGRITPEHLQKYMPPCSDDSIIAMCGPRPMIMEAIKPELEKQGWKPRQFVSF